MVYLPFHWGPLHVNQRSLFLEWSTFLKTGRSMPFLQGCVPRCCWCRSSKMGDPGGLRVGHDGVHVLLPWFTQGAWVCSPSVPGSSPGGPSGGTLLCFLHCWPFSSLTVASVSPYPVVNHFFYTSFIAFWGGSGLCFSALNISCFCCGGV